MTQNIWRSVTPQYDQFSTQITQYAQLLPLSFFDIQPRLTTAIKQFVSLQGFTRILLINGPDNSIYRNLLSEYFSKIISNKPVITTETLDLKVVFGQFMAKDGKVTHQSQGLLEQANGGFLLISANLLLANPTKWTQLKAALLGEQGAAINSNPKSITEELTPKRYDIKLVIVGERSQLADIDYMDTDFHSGLCVFSEIEQDLSINEDSISIYLGYLRWLTERYALPNLTPDAITALMTAGARFTEDQGYMPLCLLWHRALLEECALQSEHKLIEKQHVNSVLETRYYRESYLLQRALDDILNGQVIIETEGERIGQVNGLTVVDVAGHPRPYGEPARISCIVHFGDGDIMDVERKAELGGNLHAKGMMIMQAFVTSVMKLTNPLPYSASVVFEQSYGEIDGDSASLAELCALVSALSEHPIKQEIAVTGAVDQFGRIQAVGGLNEKIEGFYRVCSHHGLTGTQGVILPASNMKNLILHNDIVNAIKNGEFNIWPVSNVDEAILILMGIAFRNNDGLSILDKNSINDIELTEPQENIISKISERINILENSADSIGIIERIKNKLMGYSK